MERTSVIIKNGKMYRTRIDEINKFEITICKLCGPSEYDFFNGFYVKYKTKLNKEYNEYFESSKFCQAFGIVPCFDENKRKKIFDFFEKKRGRIVVKNFDKGERNISIFSDKKLLAKTDKLKQAFDYIVNTQNIDKERSPLK